jgi:hypothetical protein
MITVMSGLSAHSMILASPEWFMTSVLLHKPAAKVIVAFRDEGLEEDKTD